MTYTDIPATAARLRLSYNQVTRLVLKGEIDGVRINGRWRLLAGSVDRYAAQLEQKGAASA